MIISASRRTDIPSFYPEWFINRIKAGYCAVPNPFNRNQVSHVSLQPGDVEAVVFWTRNPAPLMIRLHELDERGFAYYFLFTLVNNPKTIDPRSPACDKAVTVFRRLADQIGPERVIWRYDPIFISSITSVNYHIDNYAAIAEKLAGYTTRSFISFVDDYRKAAGRIADLTRSGITVQPSETLQLAEVESLVRKLVRIAGINDIQLLSCAEKFDLTSLGAKVGKCVDGDLIRKLFQVDASSRKDPAQRKECGCVISRDIGMYDSCLFGCKYCYATRSFELAEQNYRAHDRDSPSLLGWYDAMPSAETIAKRAKRDRSTKQMKLF